MIAALGILEVFIFARVTTNISDNHKEIDFGLVQYVHNPALVHVKRICLTSRFDKQGCQASFFRASLMAESANLS